MSTIRSGPGLHLLLALPSAGLGIALTAQLTALSWLLARQGLAIDQIALVWAAGPLAGIAGQLVAGHASDRTWWLGGRRRPWLLGAGLVAALALAALTDLGRLATLVPTLPLVAVAGAVALALDLAINVGLGPARALIADLVPPGAPRASAFARTQVLSGTLGVLTGLAGGLWGNGTMIMLAALATLPLTVLPAFALREPAVLPSAPDAEPLGSRAALAILWPLGPAAGLVLWSALPRTAAATAGPALLALAATVALALGVFRGPGRASLAALRRMVIAHGFSWVGLFALFVFLAPVTAARLPGLAPEAVGRALAIGLGLFNLVAALVPALVLVPLARRWRRARVHAGALVLTALGLLAIARMVTDRTGLWLSLAVAGIGWGSLVTLPYAMVCDRVPAARTGLMLGLFNLAVVVPQLVVSLSLGALAPRFAAPGDLFVIAAGALLVSALAWTRVPPAPLSAASPLSTSRPDNLS